MRLPENFATAQPGSVLDYSVDLTDMAAAGVNLVSATWTLTVWATLVNSTADSAPASRLIGSPVIIGAVSIQTIGNLVAGNDYVVTITGTFDDTQVIVLWTMLRCRAAGNG